MRLLLSAGLSLSEASAARLEARRVLRAHDVFRYVPPTDESLVRVPEGSSEDEFARTLMSTGLFEYAEPDWVVYPLSAPDKVQSPAQAPRQRPVNWDDEPPCPNDSLFATQYHHQAEYLDSCEAWTLGSGSPAISVGVCDTGLRLTHEDLLLNRLEGYNAVDQLWESQGGQITPAHHHGTRTTGTVAANGANGVGVTGVGWNFSHRMVRVSNQSDGGAFLSDLQHGARTSIESGDRLANVSYHGAHLSSNPATASYIKSIGGLLVWGAGNTGSNYSHADRDSDDLIVVGATTSQDVLWTSSSHGKFVDLVAPGVDILTTDSGSDSDYVVTEGTSYACPLAVGVCALVWDNRPSLSPSDVERILKENAKDLGDPGIDDVYGYGRIQLAESVHASGEAMPVADLGAYPSSGALPLDVSFQDLSTGVPSGWLWDFGDGSTSTEQNPVHTYTVADAYTVSLTVTNGLGQDQTSVVDFILADVIPPVAEFSATPTAGLGPLEVVFVDESGGGTATSWLWDFGDGSTSVLPAPTHVYTQSGFFTVSLTVGNQYGSDQRTMLDLIAVDFIPPVAAFSASPTAGPSPLVVDFVDESIGGVADSWAWSFGDGDGSAAQHPTNTYTAAGTYSVSLTVSNAWGSDQHVSFGYVTVAPGPPLVADFTGTPTTGNAPLTVHFTDSSLGDVILWEWNFGDDEESSEQNPVHTYTAPGEYDVALQVCNPDGADDQLELKKYVVVQ